MTKLFDYICIISFSTLNEYTLQHIYKYCHSLNSAKILFYYSHFKSNKMSICSADKRMEFAS